MGYSYIIWLKPGLQLSSTDRWVSEVAVLVTDFLNLEENQYLLGEKIKIQDTKILEWRQKYKHELKSPTETMVIRDFDLTK